MLVVEAELESPPAKAVWPVSIRERTAAPPGAKSRSRAYGWYRNPRDPAGPLAGHQRGHQGREDCRLVPHALSEVGLANSIDEVTEGNEVKEKRGQLEGRPQEAAKGQTQRWQPLLPHLLRVNAVARRDGQTRFTALMHHVDVEALTRAFKRQRRAASPGVDRMTVDEYEQNLEENLQRLHQRVHSGQYWPKPVLRVYIPKADGGKRGLGLPALEDKIVQSAVAEVLNAIYEADFYGFSYGFRPGRSAHKALESLEKALMTQRVNWVLDFDIRTFLEP